MDNENNFNEPNLPVDFLAEEPVETLPTDTPQVELNRPKPISDYNNQHYSVPPTNQPVPPVYPPHQQGGYSPYVAPTNTSQPTATPTQPKPKDEYNWDYNNYEGYNKEPKEKKSQGLIVFLAILLSGLVIGLIVISLVSIKSSNNLLRDPATYAETSVVENTNGSVVTNRPTVKAPTYRPGELLTTPEVATKVIPSVVGIFKYESSLYEATGLGSGFIILEQDGYYYVATNNHVISSGTSFKVRLDDTREFDAELVGADVQSDIAVLRIKADNLNVAELGDSDELLVGETVVAIGNPISELLSSSVTQGIISALNRNLDMGNVLNYIQTDAAINPGNSGGALVNMYGEVIGINTAKVQGAGLEGLGFALPINDAKLILYELVEFGKVSSRPVLGITGVEITELMAYELNLPVGLMVKSVSKSANFTPQLEVDDIITHLNGERIVSLSTLKTLLAEYKIGDEIELTVYRTTDNNEENLTISVVLIAQED